MDLTTSPPIDPVQLEPRLEKLVGTLQGKKHVRHVVVGASTVDGSWTWSGAAGTADMQGTPMRSDTPWFLASVTKLYIASVVLRLMEKGLVDLDVPIPDYLPPELTGGLHVLDGVDRTSEITCRHLLAHASGLPDYLERPRGGRSIVEEVMENVDRGWTPVEAVTHARDRISPHFPPSDPGNARAKIRYSDTNFQLLMVIAEQVSGRSMPDLYRDLLFEPLGLNQTWLPGDDSAQPRPQSAITWLDDWPLVDRPRALRSIGDLYSTLDDVLRFGKALVTGEVFDDPGTVELMRGSFRRFGIPRSMAAIQAPGWPIEYGLGMMRFEPSRLISAGRRVPALLGHTGSTGSWLWHVPSLGILLAGTVDQARGAAIPFRQVPGALLGVR